MTNVSIMDPNTLAAVLDNNTESLFGGRKGRKYNPYPRMRIKEKGTRSASVTRRPAEPEPLPDRSHIQPLYVYAAEVTGADEKEVVRKILTQCSQARVLTPQIGGEPALPGYLLLAFDHPMDSGEAALVKTGCCLLPGSLSEAEREQVLAWDRA